FMVASLASAALWVGAYMGVGFVFSRQIDVVLAWMSDHAVLALIVVVGALLTYIGFKAFERYRLGRYVDAARITIDELRELLAQEPRPFVVDVGSRLAHQSRPHIPGARMLDLDTIARADDFPIDQDIILYCACPNEESARRAFTAPRMRAESATGASRRTNQRSRVVSPTASNPSVSRRWVTACT